MKRRDFLHNCGKALGASLLVYPSLSQAFTANSVTNGPNKKVIWLMLRGAMDSLHTLVPRFEQEFAQLRPSLSAKVQGKLLPLDNRFGFHPSLKNLHEMFHQRQLLPVVAVSSGYQARSHFDGQDFLESGKKHIDHESGWLARAIGEKQQEAIAIARAMPISLRGSATTQSWYPTGLRHANQDIYSTLATIYQQDRMLSAMLEEGLVTQELAEGSASKKKRGKFVNLAKSCGTLLKDEQGPNCAMLELSGWDTHNNQGNRHARALKELDDGLAILKGTLGDVWLDTLVIIGTEFGRTVKENGTGGTDHGTASMLMMAGGAVNGGQVLGQWPGLKAEELYDGRDLRPTSNMYTWIAAAISQHWELSAKQLKTVFPLATSTIHTKLIR